MLTTMRHDTHLMLDSMKVATPNLESFESLRLMVSFWAADAPATRVVRTPATLSAEVFIAGSGGDATEARKRVGVEWSGGDGVIASAVET